MGRKGAELPPDEDGGVECGDAHGERGRVAGGRIRGGGGGSRGGIRCGRCGLLEEICVVRAARAGAVYSSLLIVVEMWNGVILLNLKNGHMIHHFILDRVIYQTKPQ
jgi:hypothetical protein